MIVQTIKTNFDSGTKDLIETIKKLIEYPIQPIKSTSIRSLFPDKPDPPIKLKPLKRTPGSIKTRKLLPNPTDKPQNLKQKSFVKPLGKDPESIFDYKLRLYRDNIK